jgi:hypothetical protein
MARPDLSSASLRAGSFGTTIKLLQRTFPTEEKCVELQQLRDTGNRKSDNADQSEQLVGPQYASRNR